MQTDIQQFLKYPPLVPSLGYVLIPTEQFSVSLRHSDYNEESLETRCFLKFVVIAPSAPITTGTTVTLRSCHTFLISLLRSW